MNAEGKTVVTVALLLTLAAIVAGLKAKAQAVEVPRQMDISRIALVYVGVSRYVSIINIDGRCTAVYEAGASSATSWPVRCPWEAPK